MKSENTGGGPAQSAGIWFWPQRRPQDFQFHRLGLEVKTTALPRSRHSISGFDQIEARGDGDLYISLLMGLRADPSGSSRFSISKLTEAVTSVGCRFSSHFLDQLRNVIPMGYDHAIMGSMDRFTRCYEWSFQARVYDMSDENVLVLRRANLQDYPHIVAESVSLP